MVTSAPQEEGRGLGVGGEEGWRPGGEGEEGARPTLPENVVSFVFCTYFLCSFLCSILCSLSSGGLGGKEIGRPTRSAGYHNCEEECRSGMGHGERKIATHAVESAEPLSWRFKPLLQRDISKGLHIHSGSASERGGLSKSAPPREAEGSGGSFYDGR